MLPLDLIKMCMHYAYGYEAYTIEELVAHNDCRLLSERLKADPGCANKMLASAAKAGKIEAARLALANGADCNRVFDDALLDTIGGFRITFLLSGRMINLFIEYGFNLNRFSYEIADNLIFVLEEGIVDVEFIELVMKVGIRDFNLVCEMAEYVEALPFLRESNPLYQTSKNILLAHVCEEGRVNSARWLLEDGADPYANGHKAFRNAIYEGHWKIVEILLEHVSKKMNCF